MFGVRLALAVAFTLFSAPVWAQCLDLKAHSSEQAQRREFLQGTARVVNTLQKEHHEATGTYLTSTDFKGNRVLRTVDGSLVGGLEFGKPDAGGFEFSLTTDTNGYAFVLKDRRDDACGFALFTDQSGIIYVAQPIR